MIRLATILIFTAASAIHAADDATTASLEQHFEKRVRPLLAAKCWECHAAKTQEGGLRLDTVQGIRKGGDSGAVVAPKNPKASLLLKAVRQTGDLKMPPEGKLKASEIADLEKWILSGVRWPNSPNSNDSRDPKQVSELLPDHAELKSALQVWLKADSIQFDKDESLPVWPDQSGHGRDLTLTKGLRETGVGTAPTWIAQSSINGMPAVRFQYGNGLAAAPTNPVDIHGDAELTILLVAKLTREAKPVRFGMC